MRATTTPDPRPAVLSDPTEGELWELIRSHDELYRRWAASGGNEQARRQMRAAWEIGLCSPGGRRDRSGDVADYIESITTPFCSATVVHREALDDAEEAARGGHLFYRGACRGCGWVSAVEHVIGGGGENAAVEDALDHTHPGWRDLPVFPAVPSETPRRDGRVERERDRLVRLCPPGWADTHGPTRSARQSMGTRHVPERGWFGGYDLAAVVTADTAFAAPEAAQLPLFA